MCCTILTIPYTPHGLFLRNDYELNLTVNQHYLENVRAELLCDGHGGLLVYSAAEDQYSSTGRFDANWAARERLQRTAGIAGGFGATSTTNLRVSALLNRGDPQRFSHQRPVSAGTTTAAGAGRTVVALANSLRARKNAPKNVWASFDLGGEGDRPPLENTALLAQQQTLSFKTNSDFGLLDQTAVSFDEGGMGLDHFATLRNAFSSANAEDLMVMEGGGGGQDFASPYYDTEVLLEMTRAQNQVMKSCPLSSFLV